MNTEDDEFDRIEREQKMRGVPDAIHHTDTSETLEYIQGWNDCRQAMLAEQLAPVQEMTAIERHERNLQKFLAEQPAQQEPWGACVYGRVFVGRLPAHARKFSEDEGVPIQWLYTSPPAQRKPLTDEQFQAICNRLSCQGGWDGDGWDLALKEAIEAAHNIKENT